jgi:hypothetical protein
VAHLYPSWDAPYTLHCVRRRVDVGWSWFLGGDLFAPATGKPHLKVVPFFVMFASLLSLALIASAAAQGEWDVPLACVPVRAVALHAWHVVERSKAALCLFAERMRVDRDATRPQRPRGDMLAIALRVSHRAGSVRQSSARPVTLVSRILAWLDRRLARSRQRCCALRSASPCECSRVCRCPPCPAAPQAPQPAPVPCARCCGFKHRKTSSRAVCTVVSPAALSRRAAASRVTCSRCGGGAVVAANCARSRFSPCAEWLPETLCLWSTNAVPPANCHGGTLTFPAWRMLIMMCAVISTGSGSGGGAFPPAAGSGSGGEYIRHVAGVAHDMLYLPSTALPWPYPPHYF